MKVNIIAICLFLLIGCAEKPREVKQESTNTVAVEQPKGEVKHYFSYSELGLIPGKVVGFAPPDDFLTGKPESECRSLTIYIQIMQPDSTIRVVKCTYDNWLNLHAGDILR